MSLKKILSEAKELFELSYSLSMQKFPFLRDAMLKNLPELTVNEEGDVIYGYMGGTDEAIFKYDTTRQTMASDYTYNELLKLRPSDFE